MAFARAILAVTCLVASRVAATSPTEVATLQAQFRPDAAAGNSLRGVSANATALHARSTGKPCNCDLGQQGGWTTTSRTAPKCVFIDLGAANGNTFADFLANKYGAVAQCPSGQWEATLVEANPRFKAPLKQVEVTHPGSVHALSATAAYMCESQTTFYLDTKSVENNYWGSSMSAKHVDAARSGHQAVTVPTVNVLKLLHETTIPGDYVILKMDIEGAEWDVLPCLAQSSSSHLIDRLLVEMHPQAWGNAGTTQPQLDAALAALRANGVDIPNQYHSQTL